MYCNESNRYSTEGDCTFLGDIIDAMSWSNPTQKEASELYSYYRNKYYEAARKKSASEKEEQTYINQRNGERAKYNNLISQKSTLEKRLSGVESIIKMLEGTGGWR